MYLFEPERTPLDISWRMFGISVRIHPLFWLTSAILGWRGGEDFQFLLLWILCVFVSILVHELGHVVAGRIFGSWGHIVLYSFGGLAIGASDLRNRWQRIAVYFAGPLAGFILLGLVILLAVLWPRPATPTLKEAFFDLLWINLGWGILNLFPIWPLDGGRISRDFLGWVSPSSGIQVSLVISMIFAVLLAIGFLFVSLFTAIFFGLFAFGSFQELQQHRNRGDPWDQPWKRWDQGE